MKLHTATEAMLATRNRFWKIMIAMMTVASNAADALEVDGNVDLGLVDFDVDKKTLKRSLLH
jgi:hypothetical protein